MSDSEEDSQDKQLKIVVIGDGACGKVRVSLEHVIEKYTALERRTDFQETSLHPESVVFVC